MHIHSNIHVVIVIIEISARWEKWAAGGIDPYSSASKSGRRRSEKSNKKYWCSNIRWPEFFFFWGFSAAPQKKKTNRVYAMAIETHAEEGNESEWWGNISIGWMWERAKWERQQAKTRDFLWFFLTIFLLEKYIHINSMQHKRWWWWDEKLFTNSSIERNVKCFHFHSHHLHDFISRDVMCMRMGQK